MTHLTRTFGVELEFIIPRRNEHALAGLIEATGVACHNSAYTHAISHSWKIVTDGSLSCQADEVALELVSPILRDQNGFDQIAKVCAVLQSQGARVNKSCGLHVHVGVRADSVKALKRLAVVYAQNEEVIDSLLPTSRRGNQNTYSGTVKNVRLDALAAARDARGIAAAINGGGRYCKLNYTAFWKYGTVEFRHHSGTVDSAKVTNWVLACLRMVATAAKEQDANVQVPTQTAPQGNLRLRRIYDMVARPEGASRDEIATMLNRRTAPPVAKILTAAGIGFEVRRGRYYLAAVAVAPVVNNTPATLATWAAQLEMTAEETAFWAARAAAVNAAQGLAA